MLRCEDGFRLFLVDGHVDMDSNLVENAIRSPAARRLLIHEAGTGPLPCLSAGLVASMLIPLLLQNPKVLVGYDAEIV